MTEFTAPGMVRKQAEKAQSSALHDKQHQQQGGERGWAWLVSREQWGKNRRVTHLVYLPLECGTPLTRSIIQMLAQCPQVGGGVHNVLGMCDVSMRARSHRPGDHKWAIMNLQCAMVAFRSPGIGQ